MSKRITIHFDFVEKDSPRYTERQKAIMLRLCLEQELGDGLPPQKYSYPEGNATIEWERCTEWGGSDA